MRIGEEPAVVQLTREQWNELVKAVKTGLLKFLPLVAAAMLGSAAAPAVGWTQQDQRPAPPALASGPQQIEMIVHGLSCPLCAYGLERKLRKLEGLDSVSVDFKTGKVRLLVQDGSQATDDRLKELVRDAGFEVVTIERAAAGAGHALLHPDGAAASSGREWPSELLPACRAALAPRPRA